VAPWTHPNNGFVGRPPPHDSATLSLVDSTGHEWKIAELPALPRRIFWVDSASADSATRRALARAFDEAALYSDDVRSASAHPAPRLGRIRLAADARSPLRAPPRRGHPTRSHMRARS